MQIQGNGERQWWCTAAKYAITGYSDRQTNLIKWPTSMDETIGTNGMYDFFWKNGVSSTWEESGKVPLLPQLQDSLNPFYNNSTNWWKYVFQTGKTLNANVQASGEQNVKNTWSVPDGITKRGSMSGLNFPG